MVTMRKTMFRHETDENGTPHSVDRIKAEGLSTDTKPTECVANGSTFIEMDTRTVYLFDEENRLWRSFASLP